MDLEADLDRIAAECVDTIVLRVGNIMAEAYGQPKGLHEHTFYKSQTLAAAKEQVTGSPADRTEGLYWSVTRNSSCPDLGFDEDGRVELAEDLTFSLTVEKLPVQQKQI